MSILMGYSEVQEGHLLYDITNKLFFGRRDVSFREDILLFKLTSRTSPPLELFTIPTYIYTCHLSELHFTAFSQLEEVIHHNSSVEVAHLEEEPLAQSDDHHPAASQSVA